MINKEIFIKHLNLVIDKINLAVLKSDRDILLIALAGLICLFCLVRLFRIWKKKKTLTQQQESFKLRIDRVMKLD
jgi:hypothetical protein